MRKKVAIIGGGISGLTAANMLKDNYDVIVFEKEDAPGGLIRCKNIKGNLFHICGGHVFNSKRKDVLNWFWTKFNREKEFLKTNRNSVIDIGNGDLIPYPIENNIFLLKETIQKMIVSDWLHIANNKTTASNFEDFLKWRFGETLYSMYFGPYNEKIWRRNLRQVPLSWMEGKLPMPSVYDMIVNNINRVKEKEFVHSSFWYERCGGSQFIANRLSENINIVYNVDVREIKKRAVMEGLNIHGEIYDKVIFCGNLKDLPFIINGVDLNPFHSAIENLEYHGTTSVFCEIDSNPYSWVYLPSSMHLAHRIICTGNFSPNNNSSGKTTATIEFTDEISKDDILKNLLKVPFNPRYITHCYNRYTYPIQNSKTREMIKSLKDKLSSYEIYFTGRFADWEYYNMDVAIGAAMDLCKKLQENDTF